MLVLAVPTATLGVLVAWLLASPQPPQPTSLVRALSDGLGSVVLGLAALPRLASGRTVPRPDWRMLAAAATAWAACEAVLLVLTGADVENRRAGELDVTGFVDFLWHVNAGRVGLVVLGCTLAAAVFAAIAFRSTSRLSSDPVVVLAALGLVLRPITGHMSQQAFGSLLAAVHAAAAAFWFGLLVAIALTARTRRDWAALLPRYSVWALRCVAVLTLSGIVNALVRLGGVAALVDTGYGRIVLAKSVALVALVVLGWWWRRTWVSAAEAHRADADDSLRRAIVEVAAVGAVFGLAATLASTG
jgi:putative copper resistance protein D